MTEMPIVRCHASQHVVQSVVLSYSSVCWLGYLRSVSVMTHPSGLIVRLVYYTNNNNPVNRVLPSSSSYRAIISADWSRRSRAAAAAIAAVQSTWLCLVSKTCQYWHLIMLSGALGVSLLATLLCQLPHQHLTIADTCTRRNSRGMERKLRNTEECIVFSLI